MFNEMTNTIKDINREKLDVVFEELRREYEWYCVAQSSIQKKRHAENIEILSYRLSNIAQVLHLLE